MCDLMDFAASRNVLYAFVVDGELMYVGQTAKSLRTRMADTGLPRLVVFHVLSGAQFVECVD